MHRAVGLLRRAVFATTAADPANIAVLCDAFLRYGSAQAMGLRQTGLNVTLYYVDRVDDFAGSEEDRARFLDRARDSRCRARPASASSHSVAFCARALAASRLAPPKDRNCRGPRTHRSALCHSRARVAGRAHRTRPTNTLGRQVVDIPVPVRLVSRIAELTSSCLIVHSTRLFNQIRPLLRRLPMGVVPHGADMSPAPASVPHERRLLIFGRLFEYKGVDTALEAFRLLPADMSDSKLIVAGRGPLAALARDRRNVEVREEYIADSDIDVLLGDARLVLLAYKDATQSGVGLQAVARGVPCIVSRAGGLPDLVPDSLPSLVVPPDDPKRLAEAIVAHIDHDEALRRTIYDHAATNFAWPVVAQQLRSELRRLGVDGSGSPTGATS